MIVCESPTTPLSITSTLNDDDEIGRIDEDPGCYRPFKNSKKRKNIDSMLATCNVNGEDIINKNTDAHDHFGASIASQMREIQDKKIVCQLRFEIQKLIYESSLQDLDDT